MASRIRKKFHSEQRIEQPAPRVGAGTTRRLFHGISVPKMFMRGDKGSYVVSCGAGKILNSVPYIIQKNWIKAIHLSVWNQRFLMKIP